MDRSDETRAEAIEAQHSAVMERAEEKGVEKAMTTRAENGFVSRVGEFYARALEKGFLPGPKPKGEQRSEEHTSELQSLMRSSYAVFCLKKKKISITHIDPIS